MRTPLPLIAGIALCLLLSIAAQCEAVIITPTTEVQWTFTQAELAALGNPPGNMTPEKFEDYLNGDPDPDYALGGATLESCYKQDVGASTDSGDFASNYSTVFGNDDQDATITWDGGAFLEFEHLFLVVKDGNTDPTVYVFDLNSLNWDGMETLQLQGFWPGTGSISHVEIFCGGEPGEGPLIPEPTSIVAWLLGAGGLGLILRRRMKKPVA